MASRERQQVISHVAALSVGFCLAYLLQRRWNQAGSKESDSGSAAVQAEPKKDSNVFVPRRPEPSEQRARQLRARSKSESSKLKAPGKGSIAPATLPIQAKHEEVQQQQKLKDAAGDSDSDDDNTEAKLPRDLLSPVPHDQATTIVVFGADGNLSEKKLLPTLFELWRRNLLPADVLVVGYARLKSQGGKYADTAEFRQALVKRLPDVRVTKHHHHLHHRKRALSKEASEEGDGAGDSATLGGRSGRCSGRDEEEMLQFSADDARPTELQLSDDPRLRFVLRCHYVAGAFNEAKSMRRLLDTLDYEERRRWHARKRGSQWLRQTRREPPLDPEPPLPQAVRMYYMSVPPFLYAGICGALQAAKALPASLDVNVAPEHGSSEDDEGTAAAASLSASSALAAKSTRPGALAGLGSPEERFVLEKPFGRDFASCASPIAELSMLKRSETYFIDHYLGKELVMNLLVLRFANVCFGSVWNRSNIKSVQVIFKERIGCEGRAGYFDQYGIIRDVMQNHLLQMVALVAMEQPLSFTAEHIRQEKLKVLNACRALSMDDLVTGQYAGYREDDGITDPKTRTETFAAAVLHVHNPRWDGVPFVLKAGKALNDSKVELRVQFHPVPGVVPDLEQCVANELVVLVQPEPAIYWKVQNKVPGLKFEVEQVRMDLLYAKSYMGYMPEAYERLLLEALVADHSHFVSEDELTAQWRIFTPVLEQLASGAREPEIYPYGSRGPKGADQLAKRHGMTKFGGGLTPYVYLADKALADAGDKRADGGAQPWEGSGAGFLSAGGGSGDGEEVESVGGMSNGQSLNDNTGPH